MGSKRSFRPLHGTLVERLVVLPLEFSPNGASAVTLTTDQKRRGLVSVTRNSAGSFTVVVNETFTFLTSTSPVARMTSGGADCRWVGDWSIAASGGASATLVCYDPGGTTPTDIAANANNRVMFTLFGSKANNEAA